MKIVILTALLTTALLAGCSSPEKKAAELLDTARFEEKQHNREHAVSLYREIVNKYPSSGASKEAAARLAEIERPTP